MIVDSLRDAIFLPLVLQTHVVLYHFMRSDEKFRETALSCVTGVLLYVICDQPLLLIQQSTASYKLSMSMHHAAVAVMSILLLRNPKLRSRPYLQRQVGIIELFEISTLWITVQHHVEKTPWAAQQPFLRKSVASLALVTFFLFRIVVGSFETFEFLGQFRDEPDVPKPVFWTVVGIHLIIFALNYFWGYKFFMKYVDKLAGGGTTQTVDYTNVL